MLEEKTKIKMSAISNQTEQKLKQMEKPEVIAPEPAPKPDPALEPADAPAQQNMMLGSSSNYGATGTASAASVPVDADAGVCDIHIRNENVAESGGDVRVLLKFDWQYRSGFLICLMAGQNGMSATESSDTVRYAQCVRVNENDLANTTLRDLLRAELPKGLTENCYYRLVIEDEALMELRRGDGEAKRTDCCHCVKSELRWNLDANRNYKNYSWLCCRNGCGPCHRGLNHGMSVLEALESVKKGRTPEEAGKIQVAETEKDEAEKLKLRVTLHHRTIWWLMWSLVIGVPVGVWSFVLLQHIEDMDMVLISATFVGIIYLLSIVVADFMYHHCTGGMCYENTYCHNSCGCCPERRRGARRPGMGSISGVKVNGVDAGQGGQGQTGLGQAVFLKCLAARVEAEERKRKG